MKIRSGLQVWLYHLLEVKPILGTSFLAELEKSQVAMTWRKSGWASGLIPSNGPCCILKLRVGWGGVSMG